MNNIFVYCEIEGGKVADVSLELLTKGRALADTLGKRNPFRYRGYVFDEETGCTICEAGITIRRLGDSLM